MLARTYRTAAELDIPDNVHRGLHRLLNKLRSGTITAAPASYPFNVKPGDYFDIEVWWEERGSARCGCFAGWTEALMGSTKHSLLAILRRNKQLACLVHSYHIRDCSEAIQALDHYLQTGYVERPTPIWYR